MKIYENADISGNLKIRGRINENVTTDGGFYSKQFGEVAYANDVPDILSSDTEFYGITVKNVSSTLTPNASFSKINTITFRAPDFYLSQNFPNTDEVTVALREDRVRVIDSRPQTFFAKGTTNERTVYTMRLPANLLATGRILEFRFIYSKVQGGNRTSELNVYLDGVRVFGHDGVNGGTAVSNVLQPQLWNVWLGVASNTEHVNKLHLWTEVLQSALNATTVKIGQGAIDTHSFGWGSAFNHFLNFDPTVEHTITFTEVPSLNDVALIFQNTRVRLL